MINSNKIFKYYLIEDGSSFIACQDNNFHVLEYFNKCWIIKPHNYISDYLWGIDTTEPEESPYRFYNNYVMKLIREITKNEAEILIGENIDENELLLNFKTIK